MNKLFEKILAFHREKGGTGKLYNFRFIEHKKGYLKLEGEFSSQSLNPGGSVQGGMMNSMLDDVTSLLIIYESGGKTYPNSTNLHSIHHRPLFLGKVIARAQLLKKGKNIATVMGEIYNSDGKLATTLIHTMVLSKTLNKLKTK